MSRLKDLMIDVQADIETVKSKKPHLTRDEVITTVSVMRDLDTGNKVTYDFIREVYDLTIGGGHCDPY